MDLTQVRQFVDGELGPEEAGVVEQAAAADGALAARIAFERTLRERTGAVMEAGSIPAPAEVRERVEQVVAEEVAQSSGEREAIPLAEGNPSVVRVNYLAVAACLAIVVGAVLFGVFGKPVHELVGTTQPDQIAVMATEARQEHDRCSIGSDALEQKMIYRDWPSIQRALSPRVGSDVPIIDLTSLGYELVGGGDCQLYPTPETSIHLVFRNTDSQVRISLFMQPDGGRGEQVVLGDVQAPDGSWEASVLSDGQLMVVLVACRAEDGLLARDLIQRELNRR